ncbi:hypothetical protein [Burkholderia vietnamiensis]|uniref:hypothetical protein n=1 Tax=Burkholderia vietnamiensis TaxID=60552 RepID=UPI0011B405FC|nr:hypothetical protein [Burkholderia vietnamiensis]
MENSWLCISSYMADDRYDVSRRYDFMDMADLGNSFGIASLIGAIVILIGVKGAKPYSVTTFVAGAVLVMVAATTASTFSHFEVIAKALNLQHRLSDRALEESLRINSLWVLIYPALVGAMGVNLLTTWFQSSKPQSERASIEAIFLRLIAEQHNSDVDSNVQREQRSSLLARRVRKNERATLVRKR